MVTKCMAVMKSQQRQIDCDLEEEQKPVVATLFHMVLTMKCHCEIPDDQPSWTLILVLNINCENHVN